MTWPRDESRPRISSNSRRTGLLALLVGGLVLAGLLVVLVPDEIHYGRRTLYCGTPLSAAFKSGDDYVHDLRQQVNPPPAGPRRYVDVFVPRGYAAAGDTCASRGRTRVWIGVGLELAALLALAGAVAAARRRDRAAAAG